MSLRPYQAAAIEFFKARPDHRAIFAHATSAGKTLEALRCAEALGARRILVVCPALARSTWAREFTKWSPQYSPHPIRFGRARKGLSKAKQVERESAYGADVQIVSYKLLREMEVKPHDILILDELHALRDPLSQQSKCVRVYTNHWDTPILGLTATPIPTEVRQLWNPLDTFWPGQWGKPQATGDISWDFQARYCHREENDYGVRYVGSKSPEALLSLATRLAPYVHRVTDKDVAPFLPPLHAEPLYLDEKRAESDVAQEWLDEATQAGAKHCAIICYNRATAHEIAEKLGVEHVLTGEVGIESRDAMLSDLRQRESSIFVATSECVRESISLSFVQRAIIFQWRTSPAQAIQLLGRFPRQDALDLQRPTFVQYAVGPGDELRAEALSARIADIQAIFKADRKSEQLVELFKARELTDDRMSLMFEQMMRTVRNSDWEDNDDT